MATAVASKPSAPNQTKMKRPPLPAVQTNGIQSSRSSPSPLTSSKRPPSGFKAPPTPTLNGASTTTNGVQPRLSQRRKETQKPGEMSRTRGGREGERKLVKRKPEPYVKTQGYVLKKYRNRQPSLVIHLHTNNFRFEQQTGSFSYTSPMRAVLEHLRAQTVPHDMIEDLMSAGVPFYEGCLIVQVKDHRSNKANKSSSTTESKGSNIPSSIHNYEQWVTPSPYVPYPEQKRSSNNKKESSSTDDEIAASSRKERADDPDLYTIVLFPTPQSIAEEAYIQANTPDSRPGNRRAGGGNIARTSSSATIPATPLSAVPPTPGASVHPAKRQKMCISGAEVQQFESKIIAATAPPLFLEPVDTIEETQQLIEAMTDSLHREKHPSPKTRKRTVAELAADERIAAQEQAFMLIMDEKANTSGKAATNDEDGTAPFEPNFETFNAIQQIKAQHAEKVRDRQREEAQQKRNEQQAKAVRAMQEQHEKEQRAFQLAKQQQRDQKERQAREAQIRVQLAHNAAVSGQPNGIPSAYPQAHSSPVIRNGTPHSNPSPVIGNVPQPGGVPMQPTSSGQGSSPGRPPSSMQHGHPAAGGIQMVHQRSRPQHQSRTGTPQLNGTPSLPNATPNIPHSTPNHNQATPVSRMTQGSPQAAIANGLNGAMMGQHNGQIQMSPEQYQARMQEKQRQQAFLQHANLQQQQRAAMMQHQQQQIQQNGQMSPGAIPMNVQQQLALQQRQQHEVALRQQQALTSMAGHPNMPNGQHPAQQPQGPHVAGQPGQQQPRPMPQGQQQQQPNAAQEQHRRLVEGAFKQIAHSMAAKFGLPGPNSLTPAQKQDCHRQAQETATAMMNKHREETQRRQVEQMQQQQISHYSRTMRGMMAGHNSMQQGNMQSVGQMGNRAPNGMVPGGSGQGFTREQMMQMQQMQQQQQQQQQQAMQGMPTGGMTGMNNGMNNGMG